MVTSVYFLLIIFFFKQKTAYEMRISDWSSDVCSSDLAATGTLYHAHRGNPAGGRDEHRTHPARHRGRRIRYDAVAGWRSTDPPQPSPRRSLGERQDRARSAGHLTGSALHLPVSQKWGPQCPDWSNAAI